MAIYTWLTYISSASQSPVVDIGWCKTMAKYTSEVVCIIYGWFCCAAMIPSVCSSNETDVLALLAFKAAIVDPLGALNSWNQTQHYCTWNGIRCGAKHPDRVVGILLRSQGLEGSLSPHIEYGTSNSVSVKGDVYSFGILLLEMFTGKRPTCQAFDENLNIHNFVNGALPNRVTEIIDPLILEDMSIKMEECVASILSIGVACSRKTPTERMHMTDVVFQVCKIRDKYMIED